MSTADEMLDSMATPARMKTLEIIGDAASTLHSRPSDVPIYRESIISRVTRDLHLVEDYQRDPESVSDRVPSLEVMSGAPPVDVLRELSRRLPTAPMFHVASAACEVIEAASRSIPDDALPAAEFFVDMSGLVIFGSPVLQERGYANDVRAMFWTLCNFTPDHGSGFMFTMLSHSDRIGWTLVPAASWLASERIDSFTGAPLATDDHLLSTVRAERALLLTSNLMLTQGGILDSTDAAIDRATRRRETRAGRPEPQVRIVDLRHSSGSATGQGRHLTKRFIVRGHWRNQAYGPAHSLRRPTWINPHIKGPDDAPLDQRDTVYVVRQ